MSDETTSAYDGDGEVAALSGAELASPSELWGDAGWYPTVGDLMFDGGRIPTGRGFGGAR
ncbi:hypothetical protein HBA53_13220 [Rhodococcus pyridinivorans]|uniref:hypothetical protein n=1 Tax=Rhodococcus pyridinivorans TaxID=103816 RepID=UPI001C30AF88|nr:hypothetical protein [Rhodococcus pyridinivorans]QXF81896.1 hypothetical protein HBA53_13220 [Rhodococcus pyridinivorans]